MSEIIINIAEEPTSKKHISWTYEERGDDIILYEIVECSYKHPQAPEHATIQRIELERKFECKKTSIHASAILLLKNALDNVSLFMRTTEK